METTALAAPDTLVGTVLGERYELIERAGRGGTAVVYRGLDQRLGRTVAVKIIHDTLAGDEDYTRRFDREARAAAALSHPNIVAIFDRGMAGERPYIVMEYVRGPSLRQVIAQQAPLTPLVALAYVDAIARALAAAHDAGLMHRDIKPENVLITPSGQVKVTDFGLAKMTQGGDSATHSVLMGTLSYLAPEIMTTGQATHASDIYAAGIVLYELLTGQKPHTGDEAANVLYKHVNVDVPPPSESPALAGHGRVPDYLDALVLACTARNPALRPPTGRALERHIGRVRQRLVQGFTSDPELAESLRSLGPAEPQPTTVLVPEVSAQSPGGPPAVAVAGVPHEFIQPDDYAYDDPSPPGPDVPVAPVAPAKPLAPARPLLQVRKEPRYVRRRRGLAALLVLLVVGLIGGGSVFYWFKEGRWTTLPAVAGLAWPVADANLRDAGFEVVPAYQYDETVAENVVITSAPGDGERVLKKSTVTVTVSKGQDRVALPPLVGKPQAEAEALLAQNRLTLGEVTKVWSEEAPAGVVLSMSEEAGASLKPGTSIALTVSQGRQPIDIHDHTGNNADEAAAALQAAGFAVDVKEEHSRDVAAGLVVSQTPNSGTGFRNDTVTLVKSLGPVMVTVPNVIMKSRDEAEAALRDLGLVAKVARPLPLDREWNLVYSQDPMGGKVVPEGSTVTITVI